LIQLIQPHMISTIHPSSPGEDPVIQNQKSRAFPIALLDDRGTAWPRQSLTGYLRHIRAGSIAAERNLVPSYVERSRIQINADDLSGRNNIINIRRHIDIFRLGSRSPRPNPKANHLSRRRFYFELFLYVRSKNDWMTIVTQGGEHSTG
jgi:hypothetical protein